MKSSSIFLYTIGRERVQNLPVTNFNSYTTFLSIFTFIFTYWSGDAILPSSSSHARLKGILLLLLLFHYWKWQDFPLLILLILPFLLITDIRNKKNFHFFYSWNWNGFSPILSQTILNLGRIYHTFEESLPVLKSIFNGIKLSVVIEKKAQWMNRCQTIEAIVKLLCPIQNQKHQFEPQRGTWDLDETEKGLLNFRISFFLKRWVWDATKLWINLY